jgi:hypothetical protein
VAVEGLSVHGGPHTRANASAAQHLLQRPTLRELVHQSVEVPDLPHGAQAMMTSPSPKDKALEEKHGVILPFTLYIEE